MWGLCPNSGNSPTGTTHPGTGSPARGAATRRTPSVGGPSPNRQIDRHRSTEWISSKQNFHLKLLVAALGSANYNMAECIINQWRKDALNARIVRVRREQNGKYFLRARDPVFVSHIVNRIGIDLDFQEGFGVVARGVGA